MKKTYMQPLTSIVVVKGTATLLYGSWGVDGEKKTVIEGNPDGELDAKKNWGVRWDEFDTEEDDDSFWK